MDSEDGRDVDDAEDLVPALAARALPQSRRKPKKVAKEYYDFSKGLLNIEIFSGDTADPFADPADYAEQQEREEPLVSHHRASSHATTWSQLSSAAPRRTEIPSICELKPHARRRPAGEAEAVPEVSRPSNTISRWIREAEQRAARPRLTSPVDPHPFERADDGATRARQALVAHAKAQFARQHRCCLYQLVLVRSGARFIRWDRSRAIVTERIDYIKDPQLLADFLWRFAHMSDEERGWDSTVSRPSKHETTLFEEAVDAFLHDMDGGSRRLPRAEQTLDDSATYPTWKVYVVNEVSGASTSLLVRRPFAGHSSVLGRSTRAYIAYDLQAQRLVFLKDSWRPIHPNLRAEFDTYSALRTHEVPHIPNVLFGGDIGDKDGQIQETWSQRFATAAWRLSDGRIEQHVHHRIVQDIAYPLETANERELVQALHDILLAMNSAYVSASVVNRDISVTNIMLTPDGRGILNDWDHANTTEDKAYSIGTWRFMSSRLLLSREKAHDISDDLESVFWVLIYCSLKYFARPEHNVTVEIFDHIALDSQGNRVGGTYKSGSIDSNRLWKVEYTSSVLQDLIKRSNKAWQRFDTVYYDSPVCHLPTAPGVSVQQWLEDGKSPAFWAALFAKALDDYDAILDFIPATPRLKDVHRPQPLAPRRARGRKRKARGEEDAGDEPPQPLRRSKRLRSNAEGQVGE
ncbi:hypothetical protein PsYK624_081600 [Phanerochaete sordida]|uniref:Fungal-type protein kinase domain-containing protein n=1 Tax=Phanerochaete sordida TaxID=48140 RepID=A0A9P3LFG9_9APHY|nr:hypothetical protein PsYK624_081600 [Phanerochaete sordida]